MEAYYKDYAKDFPMVVRAAWGYTVETATLAIRMVLSGVFDALSAAQDHPRASRRDAAVPGLARRSCAGAAGRGKQTGFRDVFCKHFYVTTSGNFSNPALLCCVMEMGIDRILFSVDWPFVANPPAVALDGHRAAVRRGQGQDLERQRQAAAAPVAQAAGRQRQP